MCFFTSLSANAAAVAKKYGKQLDIIEAARQILAEQEQEERARQEAGPEHKVSVYDIRLAEDIYVIPAYAEPQCVIVSGSDKLQVMQWGLIPRMAKPWMQNVITGKTCSKTQGPKPFLRSGRGECCGSITGASFP